MNLVTRALIEEVDWPSLRTDSGSGAGLPRAFEDLFAAASKEAADDAYWRIDNEALVQGELYEAAVPTLEVLLSMASTAPSGPPRRSVAELIQQIVFGEPHPSEVELGNAGIASACKSLAFGAVWVFYGWLTDSDNDVRECALLTLCKVEVDHKRRSAIFSACRAGDRSPGVQNLFAQIDRGLI
ncbi:hypothetical protein ACN265_22610 [Micromonospora sp. WMMD730]|uniref:hypothetical protein n=1 Tax=Micromonospora sp. WMMD730 TaxID=3404128 RepID=UPI003B95788E